MLDLEEEQNSTEDSSFLEIVETILEKNKNLNKSQLLLEIEKLKVNSQDTLSYLDASQIILKKYSKDSANLDYRDLSVVDCFNAIGQRVSINVKLSKIGKVLQSKNRNQFLIIEYADSTGYLSSFLFNDSIDLIESYQEGANVTIKGTPVIAYQSKNSRSSGKRISFKIDLILPSENQIDLTPSLNLSKFIEKLDTNEEMSFWINIRLKVLEVKEMISKNNNLYYLLVLTDGVHKIICYYFLSKNTTEAEDDQSLVRKIKEGILIGNTFEFQNLAIEVSEYNKIKNLTLKIYDKTIFKKSLSNILAKPSPISKVSQIFGRTIFDAILYYQETVPTNFLKKPDQREQISLSLEGQSSYFILNDNLNILELEDLTLVKGLKLALTNLTYRQNRNGNHYLSTTQLTSLKIV